ncbi:MAG: hypothetical protein ACTSO9_04465 [Candidatus Helarchaeota archaeon]
MIVEVECKKCGNKFHASLEQLDHYFYCPNCQKMGDINYLFRIMAVVA